MMRDDYVIVVVVVEIWSKNEKALFCVKKNKVTFILSSGVLLTPTRIRTNDLTTSSVKIY